MLNWKWRVCEGEVTLLRLEEKIRDKSATIGIVGIGYVGLPLAVAFAMAGFKVLGFDIRQKTWIQSTGASPISPMFPVTASPR